MSGDHNFFMGLDSHQESTGSSSSKSDQERLQAKAQRMHNRGTASKNHSAKLFQTKYSNEQLEKIEEVLKQFQVGELEADYCLNDEREAKAKHFMGIPSKLKLDLVNAQQVINQ